MTVKCFIASWYPKHYAHNETLCKLEAGYLQPHVTIDFRRFEIKKAILLRIYVNAEYIRNFVK